MELHVPSVSELAATGDDGAFPCPTSLRLRTDADQDTELSAGLVLDVADQPGTVDALFDGLWFRPGSGNGERIPALLREAVQRERRSEIWPRHASRSTSPSRLRRLRRLHRLHHHRPDRQAP